MENKVLIIDNRMRKEEKEKLSNLGYKLIEIPKERNLYDEISSHVDINCIKIGKSLIVSKNIYDYMIGKLEKLKIKEKIEVKSLKKDLESKYPHDILMNVCITGKYAIGNFKYVDDVVIKEIEKNNLIKINVNQGYTKCSIAKLTENILITNDEGIFNTINNNYDDLKIYLIKEKSSIKLLNNDLNYSNMNGFIGGCITRIDDFVFISGDINNFENSEKIKSIILKNNLKIVDLKDLDVIDYGGIIQI